MYREATSEQSSVHEGAGYDEVFQSCNELKEGLSWSLERETWTHSPDEEMESCVGEEGEEEEVEEGEEEGDEGREEGEDHGDEGEVDERTLKGGSFGSPRDKHAHPFILPKMWTVWLQTNDDSQHL